MLTERERIQRIAETFYGAEIFLDPIKIKMFDGRYGKMIGKVTGAFISKSDFIGTAIIILDEWTEEDIKLKGVPDNVFIILSEKQFKIIE